MQGILQKKETLQEADLSAGYCIIKRLYYFHCPFLS